MTPKEKAEDLIEDYSTEIGCSDFHIPKFISGVKCADGSDEYGKILDEETFLLAKHCALVCVDEIINCDSYFKTLQDSKEFTKYWYEVQTEINKL